MIKNYDLESDVLYISFYDPPLEADNSSMIGDTTYRYKDGSLIGFTIVKWSEHIDPPRQEGCALCRDCGRTVHDFVAPDDLWIEAWGNDGGVLCYDCFCERLAQKGNYSVFELKLQEGMKRESYYRSSNKVKTE